MTSQSTLAKGQTVACDMTGLGHFVIGIYVAPIKVSAKYPKGGHRINVNGRNIAVSKTPVPSDGTLTVR